MASDKEVGLQNIFIFSSQFSVFYAFDCTFCISLHMMDLQCGILEYFLLITLKMKRFKVFIPSVLIPSTFHYPIAVVKTKRTPIGSSLPKIALLG